MTDESEDEDEVVKKKKVSKATKKKAPKKTQKETKKKVSKKIVKKKTPPQKKKTLTVKGNIKTAKEASKNVQVGSFLKTPVNIPPSCFSRYPKVALTRIPCQTREDQLNCLDPRSEISRSRKRNIKQAQMFPDPVPPQTFIKNFHGSVHINCNYTKIFTNQFDP